MTCCGHCDGYMGHWARELDEHDAGWEIKPEEEDDSIGYAICKCAILKDQNELDQRR